MSEQTSELRAYLVRKTETAVLLTNRKHEDDRSVVAKTFWLPRSLLGTTRTMPIPGKPTFFAEFVCQVPDWKLTQDHLWDYVP